MSDLPPGFPKPRRAPREKVADASTRNRRNREYGARKQGDVRRWFEALTRTTARFHGRKANEETWTHLPVRVECKAGGQVNAAATAYLKGEKQAEAARAIGDVRPFVSIAAPEGMSDFLITIRSSRFVDTVQALGFYAANAPDES